MQRQNWNNLYAVRQSGSAEVTVMNNKPEIRFKSQLYKPKQRPSLYRGEAGQSVLEFALVLPLLLLLLFGIVQFGAVFNSLITLNAAAREGARLMAAESCLE
jgi:Flp pilus assembly protein TadG